MQAKSMAPITTAPRLPNSFLHPTAISAAGRPFISIKPTSIPPLPTKSRSTTVSAVQSTNLPPSPAAIPPWSFDSWKSKKGFQLPEYLDKTAFESVFKILESLPPIVFATEARRLEERLAQAALGNAFLLQGGDCAESFKEFSADNVRDTFKVLLQMSVVLMFGAQAPVIKVGTMAGQFAIPRSSPFEEKEGAKLPSYYGDYFNGAGFDEKSRTPDPQRMIWAYAQSVSTLTHIKALSSGGYADLQRLTQWNLDFVDFSRQGNRYFEVTHWLNETFGLMDACGLTDCHHPLMTATDFWTSHECLLLPYEEALTRKDSISGLYYDCSAHMLWIGEQTRQLDGPHVEFLRGISNPVGIKVGEKMEPDELVKLIDILNPENRAGRITVITQMRAEEMRLKLPCLIRAVGKAGQIVTWVCDPMHGNTIKAPCGLKTCSYDSIRAQLSAFFNVNYSEGSYPGGVHLGMSGQDVTECVGGNRKVNYDVLSARYRTHTDPRLNGSQSLELAFLIAERLQRRRMETSVLQG